VWKRLRVKTRLRDKRGHGLSYTVCCLLLFVRRVTRAFVFKPYFHYLCARTTARPYITLRVCVRQSVHLFYYHHPQDLKSTHHQTSTSTQWFVSLMLLLRKFGVLTCFTSLAKAEKLLVQRVARPLQLAMVARPCLALLALVSSSPSVVSTVCSRRVTTPNVSVLVPLVGSFACS